MKIRTPVLIVILLAVLGAVAFWLLRPDPVRFESATSEEWAARLNDASKERRSRALADLMREEAEAIPVLTEILGHESHVARTGAVHALARLGPAAAPATIALARLAANEDETSGLRFLALQAIHVIGPDAREAAPVLRTVLKSERRHLRAVAAGALGRIDPEETAALDVLKDLLSDPAENAIIAATAIAEYGPRARSLVALLETRLETAPAAVRPMFAFALARIAEDATPYLGVLIVALASDDIGIRRGSVMLLGDLGPVAAPAVPSLERLVDLPDVGPVARRALDRIRGEAASPPAIPTRSR